MQSLNVVDLVLPPRLHINEMACRCSSSGQGVTLTSHSLLHGWSVDGSRA